MANNYSKKDNFTGKGHWQPSQLYVPPADAWLKMLQLKTAQLDRGSGFTSGEVYNTPLNQMNSSPNQPDRRKPSYTGQSSPTQLTPDMIKRLQEIQQQEEIRKVMSQQQQRQPMVQPTIWDYLKSLRPNVQ